MSTFLTAVIPYSLEDRFAAWLRGTGGDAPGRAPGDPDHLVVDLPRSGARLHHVARAAVADLVRLDRTAAGDVPGEDGNRTGPAPERGTLFRGYAQAPDGASLVFGARGLSGALTEATTTSVDGWDGCHLLVSYSPDGLTATTDFFRMLPLLYTAGPGVAALSDSWSLLVDLRAALGLTVTVDTAAALVSSWSSAMAHHPLSATTLCHEVRLAPPGARLWIPFGPDGAGEPDAAQSPWPELFAPAADARGTWDPGEAWGTQVRRAAVRTASLAAAWTASPGASVRLALSGGLASRLILAATLMADPASEVTVYSTTNLGRANQADADTVRSLAERFGFPMGTGGRSVPRPVIDPFVSPLSVWLLDSLGLDHQLTLPSFRVGGAGFFNVSGHGAGVHQGAYGWRSIPRLEADLARTDPQLATAVAGEASAVLRQVGIDPAQGPHATEWHYVAVRNSLHGGRFAIQNLIGPRPLMQRQLVALAHAPEGSPAAPPAGVGPAWRSGPDRRSLTAAVLSVLHPALATAPYDRPSTAVSPERVTAVLAAAGGPLDSSERFAVRLHGSPADVVNGPSALFETLARDRLEEYLAHAPCSPSQDAAVPEQVRALLDDGVRVVGDLGLAEWYAPAAGRARSALDAGGPLSHAHGDAGRVLAFLPLAGASTTDPVPARQAPRPRESGAPGPTAMRQLARRALHAVRGRLDR